MIEQIQQFFGALDEGLIPYATQSERLELYVIGRSALILYSDLRLAMGGTKDIDVVQLSHPAPPLAQKAVELFGKGTEGARRLGLYLEWVLAGLPPLPGGFTSRCQEASGPWKVIRPWRFEIHDLAVTKLKSFRPQDREDLQFLCDMQRLDARRLTEALEAAFRWSMEKDGDPDRDRAFANLERVSRYLQGKSRSL